MDPPTSNCVLGTFNGCAWLYFVRGVGYPEVLEVGVERDHVF